MAESAEKTEDKVPQTEEEKKAADKERFKNVDPEHEFLREYLARSLGLRDPPEKQLTTLDIEGVARYMKEKKPSNIITMAGAGISTSAGIPDFRSPETGLYHNLEKYNLPDPQAIFSIEYFRENPEPFFMLAKELWPGSFKPTPCHYFIRMLNDKGMLLRHYTQNIDTLEHVAGLDPEKVVEAHGSFRQAHCIDPECKQKYTQDWMEEKIMKGEVPKCEKEECAGVVKPDIVFFGENLPLRFAICVKEDFIKCDLLIILGTSLKVQPFASLTNRVKEETPRLYINLEKGSTGPSHPMAVLIFGGGFKFDDDDNYRDVFLESSCDDGCYKLADLLGWGDELRETVKSEHAKIDAANQKSQKESGKQSQKEGRAKTDSKPPNIKGGKIPDKKTPNKM